MSCAFLQQLRVLLPLVCVVAIGRSANLTYTEVTSSNLGHSRRPDGTIRWGGLPQATYHGNNRNAPTSPWQLTVAFTRAIINSVQTQNFPYDMVRAMMKGHFNMKDIEKYVVNIAIACFTAALLVMFLIICIVVYVRHEYRKRDKQKYFVKRPSLNARATRWLMVAMLVGTVINVLFIVLVAIVSIHTFNGFSELNERVGGAMSDVSKYFNNTKHQYEFVTSHTNDWLNRDVLGTDLDRIGHLVWEPGRDDFLPNVVSVYSSLSDLDARTENALLLLQSVDAKVAAIQAGLGALMRANITDLHFALSATLNDWSCIGCDGTCTGCQPIVVGDIYYQTDFDKLPDITGNIAQLNTLVATPTSGSMQSPEYYYYNGIPDILRTKYTSVMSELNNTINNYQRIVKDSISPLFFPTNSDLYFDTLRSKMDDFHNMLVTGDKTRFGFTWIFVMFNSLGMLFIVISLLVIIAEKRKARREIEPEYHLARVFLAGVVVGYIVLVLGFISVAMVGFYGGANLEKAACQPAKDLSFIEQVIDFPGAVSGHSGYFLSSLLLKNGNYDLKVAETYRACRLNDYAYRVLKQNITAPNLYSDLNYTLPFTNTSGLFDQLYVTLPTVILVPMQFETWMIQFQAATTFNRTSFDLVLNRSVVRADLTPYTDNMEFIASTASVDGGPLEPAKARLYNIAADLKSIQTSIDQLTVLKNDVWVDFSALKDEIDYINNATTKAVPKLRSMEAMLQASSGPYIIEGVDRYRAGFMQFLKEYTKQSHSWIPEIGLCKPVANAYDEVIYSFCDNMADFENVLWMLVGNNVVVLLVMTVLTIVAVYHLPDGLTEEDYNIGTDFESVFGNGTPPEGFIKKTIYKVKRVFQPPSIRRKSVKTTSTMESDNTTNNGNTSTMADHDALELKMIQNGDSVHGGSGRRDSKATTDNQSPSSASSSKVITVKPQISRNASAGSLKGSIRKSDSKLSSYSSAGSLKKSESKISKDASSGSLKGSIKKSDSKISNDANAGSEKKIGKENSVESIKKSESNNKMSSNAKSKANTPRPVSSVSRQNSSGKIGTVVVSEVHPRPNLADWADI